MLKVRTSDKKITPWGGINFVIEEVERMGVPSLIDSLLPKRRSNATYTYSDAILSLIYGVMCEAERLEDMTVIKERMHNGLNIPSADSIGLIVKNNLSAKSHKVTSRDGISHEVNVNPLLSNMLLSVAKHLGQIKAGEGYTLDYDNTVLACEKWDSDYSYKGYKGYQPGAFFIGETPVYVEGMNGNNPARFDQGATIGRALSMLAENGITVKTFRADCASYSPEVVKLMEAEKIEFFLRAENSQKLFEPITDQFNNWKDAKLKDDEFEITSFEYQPFPGCGFHRVVTSRRPADKPHHITGQAYMYRSIITSNRTLSDLEVIAFYNMRGAIELNFTDLGNDWNWNRLPFSFLKENTAYMIISALGYTIYKYIAKTFAARVDFVHPTSRLKAFRFNCIAVAGEWHGGELVIHDASRPWERLLGKAS